LGKNQIVMTESELIALLDAHDALVKACVDSSLTFDVFVSAYDGFPRNYALDSHKAVNQEERARLALFRRRIAFHLRVAGILSRVDGDEDNANLMHQEAGRFFPALGLMRIRELVALCPEFKAEPDDRS
jgi:hypothetical protein